ncbi:MAG TPA: tetratricopeptide repeat protein [Candidatus Wujingus californicus]|uniref:tetratricopeptide repeat protein n=1 Tax=Candidatus Wujingus californicus TaxID=3367618 RepID=UPI001D9AED1B|nr:tetratricopeptide repeat protein [Planctomycetota bacterium]MDO8130684.1 tetratricopeptide repeat protein [Candidatus Brocadiales bacterium]
MWILRMNIWVIVIVFVTFISLNGCGKKEGPEGVAVTDSGAGSGESTDSEGIKKEVKLPENMTAKEYYNFGLEQIKKGMFDEAIAAWEKAIELEPTMANAYEKLGKAYYTQGRFQKAGEIYRKELELKPDDPMIYFSLGVVYRMNEQYEDAVKMQTKALDLNPNLATSYNELGLTYCKQKKLDEAVSAHKRALELDPKIGTAHNYLGVVYLLKGMSAEAQEEFEQFKKYEAGKNMPPQHGAASGH